MAELDSIWMQDAAVRRGKELVGRYVYVYVYIMEEQGENRKAGLWL